MPPERDRAASAGRLFGLIGDPIRHSISPALYAAGFEALGVDARYEARRTPAQGVADAMRALADTGGGNVTIPHKLAAAGVLDVPTEAVVRSGACNCFWGRPGGELAGDNTDVAAFADSVRSLPGVRLRDARVLLLGAGGGARAVMLVCLEHGVGEIEIVNRDPERAAEAAASVMGDAMAVSVRSRAPSSGAFDLVVNATSLGLHADDPLPIDLAPLDVGAAFDLVYGAEGTAWTRSAGSLGIPVRDGLDMLVRQAGHSIRNWLDMEPPLAAMWTAATRALDRSPAS